MKKWGWGFCAFVMIAGLGLAGCRMGSVNSLDNEHGGGSSGGSGGSSGGSSGGGGGGYSGGGSAGTPGPAAPGNPAPDNPSSPYYPYPSTPTVTYTVTFYDDTNPNPGVIEQRTVNSGTSITLPLAAKRSK